MTRRSLWIASACVLIAGCSAGPSPTGSSPTTTGPAASPTASSTRSSDGPPFTVTPHATFDEPWAMTFLPDGNALVTERGGALLLVDPAGGQRRTVTGTPEVAHGGQGGLGDIVLAPSYPTDRGVYLTWAEAGAGGKIGAALGRARLVTGDQPRLEGLRVIWRQEPKTSGTGHFSHRVAVSPDRHYLFLSSGDRQKLDPAQDLQVTLGKVLRLNLDGSPAAGNPFADRGGVSTQIWSYGHRNPLGLAFDQGGNLWSSEMGPQGGDEVNLIERGKNYGWPRASNGSHYGGEDIPDHRDGDGYAAPRVWWNPSISPGSLMIYTGDTFPQWKGDAFVGALSGKALIRVDLSGKSATKGDQWDMGARIREVEQGPDGSVWLLEDAPAGRMLRLTPTN
ncbi:MAG: PQQ-dependent sugar dehydrogenase [Austwickia sp.]|nr:PQQ-dependent sugar dehydrogenase [Austwickia sp.]